VSIKTKVEKIESAGRVVQANPTREIHYQATIQLLCEWSGDSDALLTELRRRNRHKPRLEPLDLSDVSDQSVDFVMSINRVAERLRSAPQIQEWQAADSNEAKPRHVKLIK
jgi:hypothetical protein